MQSCYKNKVFQFSYYKRLVLGARHKRQLYHVALSYCKSVFETQYINSGNFQALVEAIPMVTGIDQGFFNPSFTILNGLRNSKNGWELGFGAAIGFSKMASGYYDENQKWNLEKDWNTTINGVNNYQIIEQADSRGTFRIVTGFVLAVGKTFRSGKLNIPINMYVIPDKSGFRVGANFGFNITQNK